jgi:hypothetical protein
MKRPDLLDALCEKAGPGGKLLLCIVTTRHAVHGIAAEDD